MEICLFSPVMPMWFWVWLLLQAGQVVMELLPRGGQTFHHVPLLQHGKS